MLGILFFAVAALTGGIFFFQSSSSRTSSFRLSETEIRIPPNNGELLQFGGAHSTPLPTAGLPGEGEDALIVGAREFNGGEGEGEEVQPVEAVFTSVVLEPINDVLDGVMRLVVVLEAGASPISSRDPTHLRWSP